MKDTFSLCMKCGNIKPVGATECEFCKNANTVTLAELKQSLQGVQQAPPNAAGSAAPATPAPGAAEPAGTPPATTAPEDLSKPEPSCFQQERETQPACPKQSCCKSQAGPVEDRQAVPAGPPCKPGRQEEAPRGWRAFMDWLKKLFG